MNWERELETESLLDIYLSESFWTFLYNSVSSFPHTFLRGACRGDRQNHWQMKRSQLAARQRAGLCPLYFCIESPFFQSHIQQGQSFDPQSLLPICLGFFPISQATDLSCTDSDIQPLAWKASRLNPEQLPHTPPVRSVLKKETADKISPALSRFAICYLQWGPGISCVSIIWEQIQTPGPHPRPVDSESPLSQSLQWVLRMFQFAKCCPVHSNWACELYLPLNTFGWNPKFPASTALSTGLGHNHLHLPCC